MSHNKTPPHCTPGESDLNTPRGNHTLEIQELTEQETMNHLMVRVLRLTEQKCDAVNQWMKYQGHSSIEDLWITYHKKPEGIIDDLYYIPDGQKDQIKLIPSVGHLIKMLIL